MPEYLSALNSAWLNEAATLFRRQYYQSAHAGYIMYVTDAAQSGTDVEALRDAMRSSKGLGNFKICFSTHRTENRTALKLCRSARWQRKTISSISKKSQRRRPARRAPHPAPADGRQAGKRSARSATSKVAKVFVRNELIPLQDRMREVNAWAGQEVIRFKSYNLDTEVTDFRRLRAAFFLPSRLTASKARHGLKPHRATLANLRSTAMLSGCENK